MISSDCINSTFNTLVGFTFSSVGDFLKICILEILLRTTGVIFLNSLIIKYNDITYIISNRNDENVINFIIKSKVLS